MFLMIYRSGKYEAFKKIKENNFLTFFFRRPQSPFFKYSNIKKEIFFCLRKSKKSGSFLFFGCLDSIVRKVEKEK
jgi:hypothetical protein